MTLQREDILAIKSYDQLRKVDCRQSSLGVRSLSPQEITHILKLCDGFWMFPYSWCETHGHEGVKHAKLTSGRCSDGFVNVMKALKLPGICEMFAHTLVTSSIEGPEWDNMHFSRVDWVIGSAYASITLVHEVAKLIGAQAGFTEKGEDGQQIWNREEIAPGEIVFQVEELMTTSKTLAAVHQGILDGTAHDEVVFAPAVGVLVHRSDIYEFDGRQIRFPTHYDIRSWDPAECPLCAVGSKPIPPKEGNWEALTHLPN